MAGFSFGSKNMKQITLSKALIFSFIIFFFSLNITRVWAFSSLKPAPVATSSASIKPEVVAKKLDPKAEILAKYLAKHDSPLQYHAQDFIDAANSYGLDWRLVAAISGVESTFGKFIPGGFNGWGWGVYGTQAVYFKSWKEGIYTVSQGLRENYINKGLTSPYQMNRVYAASPFWGGKVTFFMNDLDKFAQNYKSEPIVEIIAPTYKVAAFSGILANLE